MAGLRCPPLRRDPDVVERAVARFRAYSARRAFVWATEAGVGSVAHRGVEESALLEDAGQSQHAVVV